MYISALANEGRLDVWQKQNSANKFTVRVADAKLCHLSPSHYGILARPNKVHLGFPEYIEFEFVFAFSMFSCKQL